MAENSINLLKSSASNQSLFRLRTLLSSLALAALALPGTFGCSDDDVLPDVGVDMASEAGVDAGVDQGGPDACQVTAYEVTKPPTSMDKLYPTGQPSTWLLGMFAMEAPLGELGVRLQDKDTTKAAFQRFKTEYNKMALLVPEWSKRFPAQPLTDLESALNGADPAKIGAAMGALGKVCGSCHEKSQPSVWYRYAPKVFHDVKLTNPLSSASVEWDQYMFALSGSFAAVSTYMTAEAPSGPFTKTTAALGQFKKLFEGLKEGCKECHGKTDTRNYYVSSDITAMIVQAEQELAKTSPDLSQVGKLLQGVGGQACRKCHVVHTPASSARHIWKDGQSGIATACGKSGTFLIVKPPKSMDQYYPDGKPSAWLAAMFAMEGPLGEVGVHLQDKDTTKAKAAFQKFKTEYSKVAKMVPEWSSYFAAKPLADLETALNGVDAAKIGAAMGTMGKVCGSCHTETQPAVWYRYGYKDIETIKITNPLTTKSEDWHAYMTSLAGTFGAVSTYMGDEAAAKAGFTKTKAAVASFKKVFLGLREGCKDCHGKTDTRKYYVSDDVVALITKVETELAKTTPDVAQIGKDLQAVGSQSCYRCHVLHIPAAAAKEEWAEHSP